MALGMASTSDTCLAGDVFSLLSESACPDRRPITLWSPSADILRSPQCQGGSRHGLGLWPGTLEAGERHEGPRGRVVFDQARRIALPR